MQNNEKKLTTKRRTKTERNNLFVEKVQCVWVHILKANYVVYLN